MSENLHWVKYDPAQKIRGFVEPSARLHLSRRAKVEKLRKLSTKTDHPLSSKAREIIGWHQQPDSQNSQIVNDNDMIGESTDTAIRTATAVGSDAFSIDTHRTSCFMYGLNHNVPQLYRSVNTSHFDQSNDFTSDLVHYTTTVWLPSPEWTPQHCHLGGHAPIYESDGMVAQNLLRQAFQSRCRFLLLALSAFVSARMKFVSKIIPKTGNEPEYFCVQAIKALQMEITVQPTRLIIPDRDCLEPIALGLAFLMLTASFVHSDDGAIGVYGQMLNHAITELGGVEQLSEFASYFIVATDFLTATANMCNTSLHLSDYSSTYEYFEQGSPRSCTFITNRNIRVSGLRFSASVRYHNLLRPVIETALSFDQAVTTGLRAYLREHSARFYQTATSTIQPNSQQATLIARTDSSIQERLARADEIQSDARYLAISLWLRLLILQVVADTQMPPSQFDLLQPRTLTQDGFRVLQLLRDAQIQVQDTGWTVPDWQVQWMLSLASCLFHYCKIDPLTPQNVPYVVDIVQICKNSYPQVNWDKRSITASIEKAVPLNLLRSFDQDVADHFWQGVLSQCL